ncbi:hypothetical protein LguiA_002956 [Lonicera macranthoides]
MKDKPSLILKRKLWITVDFSLLRGAKKKDCCKWRGIRCSNRTGHVILLDLHAWFDDRATGNWVRLSGKANPRIHWFPRQITTLESVTQWFHCGRVPHQLTNLKYLNLSANSYYASSIPEFIGSLSKLQHLDLSHNYLVGRVPHQLGNLTNLRSFHLGYNHNLTVDNLEWLSDLRLLRHLHLSFIDLQKVDLLQSINRLSFLSSLHLVHYNLPGIIPPSLHLTNLSFIPLFIIHLSRNSFTNSASYNWLFNFSNSLVDVDMSSNPLGGSIPAAFGNMMSLESLSLSKCDFEGEIPKSFKNLSRIRSLVLHSNNLTGQLPELFQTLFTSNKLNGSFPKHFGQSSPLEYIDLSENELNGSLPNLTSFPLLRYLSFTNNKIQGRLPQSIGELSNLKTLDLSFNFLTLEFSSDWTPRF